MLLDGEPRAEHQHPRQGGCVEGQHRAARGPPGPVVSVDPTPDVAHHGAAEQDRQREDRRPDQRGPDTQQEIAFGTPTTRAISALIPTPKNLRPPAGPIPPDQPPEQDRRSTEGGKNGRQQTERGGHRDEYGHRQSRIDQAADPAQLTQQGPARGCAWLRSSHGPGGRAQGINPKGINAESRSAGCRSPYSRCRACPPDHAPAGSVRTRSRNPPLTEPDQRHGVGTVEELRTDAPLAQSFALVSTLRNVPTMVTSWPRRQSMARCAPVSAA